MTDQKINIYLAGPIFTERDRDFNEKISKKVLEVCPNANIYLAQNNKQINDKTGCANSADIYSGDIKRLKETDLLITIMSADMPPIGSSYECAYFTSLCEQDENKSIVALYDDCREGNHTYSSSKLDAMISGNAENQWPYVNLLAVGFVKKFGYICFNSDEFVEKICQRIKILEDPRISGIYKITNLKNNLSYIGQTVNFHNRWISHKNFRGHHDTTGGELHYDMEKLGLEYFKFEILEKCDEKDLDEREKYWIEYCDSYNLGYNETTGGSGNKSGEKFQSTQTVKVYSYNLDGTFFKEYNSIAQAMRECGLKSNNITRVIGFNDNKHKSGELMWRLYKKDSIEPFESPVFGKEIFCYDENTREFVMSFKNAIEAKEKLNITNYCAHHINDCAAGQKGRKKCAGFLWSYKYYERLPEYEIK